MTSKQVKRVAIVLVMAMAGLVSAEFPLGAPARTAPLTPEEVEAAKKRLEELRVAQEKLRFEVQDRLRGYVDDSAKGHEGQKQLESSGMDIFLPDAKGVHEASEVGRAVDFKKYREDVQMRQAAMDVERAQLRGITLAPTERALKTEIADAQQSIAAYDRLIKKHDAELQANPTLRDDEDYISGLRRVKQARSNAKVRLMQADCSLKRNEYVGLPRHTPPPDEAVEVSPGRTMTWKEIIESDEIVLVPGNRLVPLPIPMHRDKVGQAFMKAAMEKGMNPDEIKADLVRVGVFSHEAKRLLRKQLEAGEVLDLNVEMDGVRKPTEVDSYLRGVVCQAAEGGAGDFQPVPANPLADATPADLARIANDGSLSQAQRNAVQAELLRRGQAGLAAGKVGRKKVGESDESADESSTTVRPGVTPDKAPQSGGDEEWTLDEQQALILLMWARDQEAKSGGGDYQDPDPNVETPLEWFAHQKTDGRDDAENREWVARNARVKKASGAGLTNLLTAAKVRDEAGTAARQVGDKSARTTAEEQGKTSWGSTLADASEKAVTDGLGKAVTDTGKHLGGKVADDAFGSGPSDDDVVGGGADGSGNSLQPPATGEKAKPAKKSSKKKKDKKDDDSDDSDDDEKKDKCSDDHSHGADGSEIYTSQPASSSSSSSSGHDIDWDQEWEDEQKSHVQDSELGDGYDQMNSGGVVW